MTNKRNSQDSSWTTKSNPMLNISTEQKKAWCKRNASQVLLSRTGAITKFNSPNYNVMKRNHREFFKLTDLANNKKSPFSKIPVNKYNILLRSTHMNDMFFDKL